MGETLLKGYLQIKCANPGRIVRKVRSLFHNIIFLSCQSVGRVVHPL